VKEDARRLALEALARIDGGAFANIVVPAMLEESRLADRDRHFVTELVYGTTRMRRACDFLVDRFVMRELDDETRRALRLGAYQLHFLQTPAHAAVSATVEVAPKRSRGLVNAVLRKVSSATLSWPDEATRLSYPDWIVERLTTDLGAEDAAAALVQMNQAPDVTTRDDGYIQDLASQWVATAVGGAAGERVLDLCAAPGGKATAMARSGAWVGASDVQPARASRVLGHVRRLATDVSVVAADGRRPAFRAESAARVLVDAPCSGLGVLRRRADARWRIQPDDVTELADLQRELVGAGAELVAPGGRLVYSVCTVTAAETLDVDEWLARARPDLEAEPIDDLPGTGWRAHGRGAILLPQDAGTDGMFLLRVRRVGVRPAA
jgi:16S rRNA (cytosine967-C5)-methyltransferase